jgi:hypothetical protein
MNANMPSNPMLIENDVTRRKFCNRLLTTSAAMIGGRQLQSSNDQGDISTGPAVKLEGATMMKPNSFLLFNYPNRTDPAIWFARQMETSTHTVKNVRTWVVRSALIGSRIVSNVRATLERMT